AVQLHAPAAPVRAPHDEHAPVLLRRARGGGREVGAGVGLLVVDRLVRGLRFLRLLGNAGERGESEQGDRPGVQVRVSWDREHPSPKEDPAARSELQAAGPVFLARGPSGHQNTMIWQALLRIEPQSLNTLQRYMPPSLAPPTSIASVESVAPS